MAMRFMEAASGVRLSASGCHRIVLLHKARQVLHVLDRGFGQDAVAEIEDVAGTSGGAAKNVFRARFQFFPVGEQQYGIEISLHGGTVIEMRCQPSSSGMRQSRPITSAPVSFIAGRSVALSVPK